MNKMKKGFTLIELMIVVAIIGILAAIAIPKFADLIKKSKEGSTKGSLGALRSALTIYYGEQEGTYPNPLPGSGTGNQETTVFNSATGPFLTKYLDKMPTVKLGQPVVGDTDVCVYATDLADLGATHIASGKWWYRGQTLGEMHVAASGLTDTKQLSITSW